MSTILYDRDIMEKLVDKILERQLKDRESSKPYTYIKNIFKVDRDKLFKGHLGSITYGQYEDETCFIAIANRYYSVTLRTEYYFSNNKTVLTAMTEFPVTKYFKDFMDTITDHGKLVLENEDSDSMNENTVNYRYDTPHFFSLQYTYKYDGFLAFNHYENLIVVKNIKDIVRRFKSIVRENKDDPAFFNNVRYIKGKKVYLSKSLFT